MLRAAVCLCLLGCLSACIDVNVRHVSDRYATTVETCNVDFQSADMERAKKLVASGYQQVAALAVEKGGTELSDEVKEKTRPEICRLGGNVAVLTGSSEGSFFFGWSYMSLIVLRRPASIPESPAKPTAAN